MTAKTPDKSPPDAETPPDADTRVPRASVMLTAIVEYFGGREPTMHRVRDLSRGGVRIDQASHMRVGATVLISVGALEAVGASVVWAADGLAGLAFTQEIDPELARTRAAKPPKGRGSGGAPAILPKPSTGWMVDVRNPYRK